MRTKFLKALGLATSIIASASASAQTAPTPLPKTTYIHAGKLLDRPGQPPRDTATVIIRDGKVVEVRDGFAPPPKPAPRSST